MKIQPIGGTNSRPLLDPLASSLADATPPLRIPIYPYRKMSDQSENQWRRSHPDDGRARPAGRREPPHHRPDGARLIDHIAMNGAGAIHDYELARIGATTESVARYIQTGEFGLWQETGELNDWISRRRPNGLGLGETSAGASTRAIIRTKTSASSPRRTGSACR